MWFGRSRSGKGNGSPDKSQLLNAKRRSELAEQALLQGKLPAYVTSRIEKQLNCELPWTSDLTVNEWFLLRGYGFESLGFVSGCSYYHISYQVGNGFFGGSYDMRDQEEALYAARESALNRLQEEARLLGANAVVGVRLQIQDTVEQHRMAFSAFGTAVRIHSLNQPNNPILCTVSGQKLVKLLSQGALPVGLAIGIGVFYQYSSQADMRQTRGFYNQEVPILTDSVYHVRRVAMNHMRSDLQRLDANGLLGQNTHFFVKELEVERGENDTRVDHIVQFMIVGTAVSDLTFALPLQVKTSVNLR